MTNVTANLDAVRERIHNAALHYGRRPETITLVAVAKRHPPSAVRDLAAAGQEHFAESYAQEAAEKLTELQDLALCWHFIGRLQRNKTAAVAEQFDWVHSVDRLVIAERLSAQRPDDGRPPLQVCLQVDFTGEDGRNGVPADALPGLAEQLASLPRLRLRGLMTLPPREPTRDGQRQHFRQLASLQRQLIDAGHTLDTLSAGMSQDLEAAIAEGATHVRIGTALFGPRPTT